MKARKLLIILEQIGHETKAPRGLHARIMTAAQEADSLPMAPLGDRENQEIDSLFDERDSLFGTAVTERYAPDDRSAALRDRALPQAAAAELQGPMRIPTEGGKYTIVIRRSSVNTQQGVITVEVTASYRAQLEGHHIILRDGQGRLLVHGRIVNGEVSQIVEDFAGLILEFVVEPA